jgi:hypothetical protein
LWCFGSASPAIRYSPDENCETSKHTLKKKIVLKSGAAATVGFIASTAALVGHLKPIKVTAELLLPKITVKLPENFIKRVVNFSAKWLLKVDNSIYQKRNCLLNS